MLNHGSQSVASSALVTALSHAQSQAAGTTGSLNSHPTSRNFATGEMPLAQLNSLHAIKASGMANGSSQVDAMTIDIVAMLFDYVFEDKGIPDAIKALLARLQIPILKVAILDKSFFSRKNHPSRRLLDVLADASVCFAAGATHEDPLYKKIEEIVDGIQTGFDTDIELFTQMLARFEQFLAARETANATVIEQSARVLHEREKRELARLIAQDETERRVAAVKLPTPVAAMLIGPWTRVLERIYLRESGRNSGFTAALETVDNLIWSVSPKVDTDQRKRLVSLLPTLLRQLHEGMQIAAVEKDDSDRFFSALVDCHAAAVRAGLKGESVSALLVASKSNAEIAPLFAKLIAEETAHAAKVKKEAAARSGLARILFTGTGVEIEEIGPVKSDGTQAEETAAADDGHRIDFDVSAAESAAVADLKRGTWVEFIHNSGEKLRAKLSWISPLKGVYLFTNPGSAGAISVTPEALLRQLRHGDARVIEESSLIDRAVDNMVHSLSGTALG